MKPLIVANWKMNPTTLQGAKLLFDSVARGIKNLKNVEVVICPPYTQFSIFSRHKRDSKNIKLGAQDVFWENSGAYTGEISPSMLKDLACQYVIIGHSERRRYQKENDEMINRKLKAAIKEKLKPILCIENISQVKKGLNGISNKELKNLVIAYEPVFAIGTGKSCSIVIAKKMRIFIKKSFKNIPVLYGGSINSQNAQGFITKGGFQGLLIGGASLNLKEFIGIVKRVDES